MAVPTDFAGLLAWHEAPSQPEAVDAAVSQLVGLGGTPNSQVQGNAGKRPLVKLDPAGNKVLRLDAADDFIIHDASVSFTARPYTIFVVYAARSNNAARRVICGDDGGGHNWLIGPRSDLGGKFGAYVGNWLQGPLITYNLRVHTVRVPAAGDAIYRIDGVQVANNAVGTHPGNPSLGPHPLSYTEPADSDWKATVMYNTELLDADMAAIEAYLSTLLPPPLGNYVSDEAIEVLISSVGAAGPRVSDMNTEILIENVPVGFIRVSDLNVEIFSASEIQQARVADLAVETLVKEAIPDWTGVTPEALLEDCTVLGIINAAQFQSGIKMSSVTTRGHLGVQIIRHRAELLQRLVTIWEGVEVRDMTAALAATIALTDLSEIVTIQAKRALTQEWEPVTLVSFDDQDHIRPAVFVRGMEATLIDFPAAWGAYDQIKFIGPQVGLLPDDYALDLAPNVQIAPLFCRALKLHAQGFLEMKNQDIAAAKLTRAEYVEVVGELLAQARAQREIMTKRFTNA